MNEQAIPPASIAAAAVAIGGILIMLLPQHGMSIVRLVIVTVAAGAALYALTVNAPARWWMSPFDLHEQAREKRNEADETEWIQSTLSGRRQHIENGPPMPPEALRLLQPLIRAALEREGIELEHRVRGNSQRRLVSQLTWAIFTAEPLRWPPWYRTVQPDRGKTAEVVDLVLDDLDRLAGSGNGRQHSRMQ